MSKLNNIEAYAFTIIRPEGWLLDIASENWKINKNDRMGLLLVCCQNCVGAVSVEPCLTDEQAIAAEDGA